MSNLGVKGNWENLFKSYLNLERHLMHLYWLRYKSGNDNHRVLLNSNISLCFFLIKMSIKMHQEALGVTEQN